MKLEKWLQLLISIAILFFLFRYINLGLVYQKIKTLHLQFVILAILLYFLSVFVRIFRLYNIINKDEHKINLWETTQMSFIGAALNFILPASTGEVAMSYYGYKLFNQKGDVLASVLIDKLFATISIFTLSTLSSLIYRLYTVTLVSFLCTIILGIIIYKPTLIPWKIFNKLLFFFTKKTINLKHLTDASRLSSSYKILSFLLSFLGWYLVFYQAFLFSRALSIHINFNQLSLLYPLVSVIRLLPITLNGIGAQEAVSLYLFKTFINIDEISAMGIALLMRCMNYFFPALIGTVFITLGIKKKHPIHQSE